MPAGDEGAAISLRFSPSDNERIDAATVFSCSPPGLRHAGVARLAPAPSALVARRMISVIRERTVPHFGESGAGSLARKSEDARATWTS